jgi:hypothetical protein
MATLSCRRANLLVALFVLLHGPDGQEYYVATEQITTLRAPVRSDAAAFAPGVRCLVVTTSGKFVPAVESCGDIYKAIRLAK